MIVAKFGGTCVTAANVKKIAKLVGDDCGAVVVSAVGKSFSGDVKTTDALVSLHGNLPCVDGFSVVEEKYRALYSAMGLPFPQEETEETLQNILTKNHLDYTVGCGEQLAAKAVSRYLSLPYAEADELFFFDENGIDKGKTYAAIRAAHKRFGRFVTGGFYGSKDGVRKLFPRGGSDVSGALVAAALSASLYENWTDVCGFCIADPRLVPDVSSVRCLCYDDAELLARAGASVLHPDAIEPCREAGVAICVRNVYDEFDAGTLISSANSPGQLLGVVERAENGKFFTTVVHTLDRAFVAEAVSRAVRNSSAKMLSLRAEKNSVVLQTDLSLARQICSLLQ